MRVKLLEAMACGTPVVTTARGASGMLVHDGQEYLRAESAEEFAERAVRLASEPGLRQALAEAARRYVEREHAIAVQGERRERIWAAALARELGRVPARRG